MSAPSRGSLLIVFLVVFIDLLGFGIVLPLLARYGEHFHPTRTELVVLMSSFSAMQFLFAPLWGKLSDRIGRRPVLMVGLAGSVVFYALFGFISDRTPDQRLAGLLPIAWLIIARIGAGIAGATIPTAQAYIADVTDEKSRGKGMALIGAAFGLGFTFGPLLAAGFASNEIDAAPSPYAGYLASALSAMALAGAIFLLPESLQPGKSGGHRGWLKLSALGQVVRSPLHIGIILSIFLSTLAFAQFETTLGLLTERLGLPERQNFYVFAYLGFMLMLFQGAIVRRLLPRLGERRMAIAGTVLLIAGFALVAVAARSADQGNGTDAAALAWYSRPLWQLFGVLWVAVAGFSAVNPALQSLLSVNTGADEQGEMLGLGQSVSALARIIGPATGIVLFGTRGVQSPYWSAAGLMVIATVCILSLRSARQGTDSNPAGRTAPG